MDVAGADAQELQGHAPGSGQQGGPPAEPPAGAQSPEPLPQNTGKRGPGPGSSTVALKGLLEGQAGPRARGLSGLDSAWAAGLPAWSLAPLPVRFCYQAQVPLAGYFIIL